MYLLLEINETFSWSCGIGCNSNPTTSCATLKLLRKWHMINLKLIEHHCLYLHTHFVTTIIHHQIIMTSVKSKSQWQILFKIPGCCNKYGNKCSNTLTDMRQSCLLHWLSASLHAQASIRAIIHTQIVETPHMVTCMPCLQKKEMRALI